MVECTEQHPVVSFGEREKEVSYHKSCNHLIPEDHSKTVGRSRDTFALVNHHNQYSLLACLQPRLVIDRRRRILLTRS